MRSMNTIPSRNGFLLNVKLCSCILLQYALRRYYEIGGILDDFLDFLACVVCGSNILGFVGGISLTTKLL
jgi:hypothetical protein